jgi:hypothetical protein
VAIGPYGPLVPLWSSGYDLSLSRRKRGFKSL